MLNGGSRCRALNSIFCNRNGLLTPASFRTFLICRFERPIGTYKNAILGSSRSACSARSQRDQSRRPRAERRHRYIAQPGEAARRALAHSRRVGSRQVVDAAPPDGAERRTHPANHCRPRRRVRQSRRGNWVTSTSRAARSTVGPWVSWPGACGSTGSLSCLTFRTSPARNK